MPWVAPFVPAAYGGRERWPVILFLHGAGGRGADGFLQTTTGLAPAIRLGPTRYPAIVLFPQLPRDSLWVGIPAQMAMAALAQTEGEFRTDCGRVYLTGLSMGGNGVWYLVYRYPDRFAAVVPISGWVSVITPRLRGIETVVPADSGPPFPALARRLRHVPIWIFHGELDEAVPVRESRQAAAARAAAGGSVQCTELFGTDHTWVWDAAYASLQLTDWLFAQRRRCP